jgi:exodeoxyribonuclease VII small subunit
MQKASERGRIDMDQTEQTMIEGQNGQDEASRLSLEAALEQLSSLLTALDGGDQTLEEAFASYKKGVELVQLCNHKIDKVEKQCRVITENGEKYDL